jgi:parallel beta-helix repeat protein
VHERVLAGLFVPMVSAAVGVGGLALAGPAHAASAASKLTCGQKITVSVRLANDLVGCPHDGLVIGADRITVDLAGHSIQGGNAPGSEGIADDGHNGLTVKNGSISHFFLSGIGLRGAAGSSVSHVTIRQIGAGGVEPDTSAGVLVKDSPGTSVSASTVTNDVSAFQSDGVDVLSSARTVISDSRIARNAWDGVVVIDSPDSRIVDNTLDRNANQGIEVNFGADRTLLARNHAAHNVSNGLVVGAISGARIIDNTLTVNGEGGLFMFDLLNSRVSGNTAHGNGVGIDLEGGQNGSSGDRITDNDASRNVFLGLLVADGANNNTVTDNVASANQGKPGEGGGIIVAAATGNKVRDNVANNNLDVGIGVFEDQPGDSTGNVLTRNVANANHNHGMDAVAGTVDGGHNRARNNTPAPDCLGVVCT